MRSGIKHSRFIPHAEVPYYIIKDKESKEAITPPMFIEADKVEKHMVYSDMLYREIAARTDSLAYYDRVLLTYGKNSSNMKNLLKHNWIYNSDMDISDRYIKNFNEEFAPDMNYKLHKCYMDIEVDLMSGGFKKNADGSVGYVGFPDEEIAPCPVNIISFVDGKSMVAYSFILRNSLNTSEVEFERAWGDEKKKEVIEMVHSRNNILLNDIIVNFYNSEEETIEAYFNKTHEIDPDIILS